MRVRPARPGDAEALRAAVSRAGDPGVFEESTETTVGDFSLAGVREAAASADCCFMAEEGGRPIGVALAHPDSDGDEAELLALWVHPERGHDGVEERLLERVAADLSKRDVRQLRASVDAADDAGERFYHACGFSHRGTRAGAGGRPSEETVVVAAVESFL